MPPFPLASYIVAQKGLDELRCEAFQGWILSYPLRFLLDPLTISGSGAEDGAVDEFEFGRILHTSPLLYLKSCFNSSCPVITTLFLVTIPQNLLNIIPHGGIALFRPLLLSRW